MWGQLLGSAKTVPLIPVRDISPWSQTVTLSVTEGVLGITSTKMSTDCHFSAMRLTGYCRGVGSLGRHVFRCIEDRLRDRR
jgi:hypothetical protein